MPKHKRRNIKKLPEKPLPAEIKGNPATLKIELFRGVTFFGIVKGLSETKIKLQICRVWNGLPYGEWDENDIIDIPRENVKTMIDVLYL